MVNGPSLQFFLTCNFLFPSNPRGLQEHPRSRPSTPLSSRPRSTQLLSSYALWNASLIRSGDFPLASPRPMTICPEYFSDPRLKRIFSRSTPDLRPCVLLLPPPAAASMARTLDIMIFPPPSTRSPFSSPSEAMRRSSVVCPPPSPIVSFSSFPETRYSLRFFRRCLLPGRPLCLCLFQGALEIPRGFSLKTGFDPLPAPP